MELAQTRNTRLILNLHAGQTRAHASAARFVVVTAGTQGGKTSYGPHWLLREIKRCGPGDYLIVTPTFQLLERKLLGEVRRVFEWQMQLGHYHLSPSRALVFHREGEERLHRERANPDIPTRIQFGYADNPDSLESMTARAAWLDEVGQRKFKRGAWQAVLRRLSLSEGRVLITTSVYGLHWLKQLVDRAESSGTSAARPWNESIEVIRFDSTVNPAFPASEFERARRDLPHWKFNMQYRGMFERPAGLIYDCVDASLHRAPRFTPPRAWRRVLGLDFGSQNMAATFWAVEPIHTEQCVMEHGQCIRHDAAHDRLYCYRTYHEAGASAAGHARRLLRGEPGVPYAVGGALSENDWRREFAAAGLPVRAPRTDDVELGINRVYGAWQRGELYAFADLDEFWDELTTYSRALDENNEPTDRIQDKQHYHLLDSMRYIIGDLKGPARELRGARRAGYDIPARSANDLAAARSDAEILALLGE